MRISLPFFGRFFHKKINMPFRLVKMCKYFEILYLYMKIEVGKWLSHSNILAENPHGQREFGGTVHGAQ